MTVNLTPRSSRALDTAVTITGDTKTDTINKALQVYAFLEELHAGGGTLYIREGSGSELERLRIL